MKIGNRWTTTFNLAIPRVPGQEVVDAVERVVGDARQHMAQPSLGIDALEFGGADQRVYRGRTVAATVGAREQVVAAANRHAAQGAFSRRVNDFDGAVVAVGALSS